MNTRALWAIARKDLMAVRENIQVWLPMVVVPLLIGVALPTGFVWMLGSAGAAGSEADEVLRWLERLPASGLRDRLAGFPTLEQRLAFVMVNYLIAPLFLLIPLMTASVVSADSFAGEKERGTLEGLLFSPVDVRTLFWAKVLAAWLPAVGLSLLSFAAAVVAVNAAGWRLFGGLFFPQANWFPLIAVVIPAVSLAAILLNVFVSARVATFQAAYQLGGLVILPVIALLVGQLSSLLILSTPVVSSIGLALAAVDLVLLLQARRYVDRAALFESQVR
ncbi:MAG TPA: ABC transporter permease subunit [Limnochordia bacterium]